MKVFLTVLGAYAALDCFWVGFAAHELYRSHLGHLMATDVAWRAVALFYPLYTVGILRFAVYSRSPIFNGALLGLFAYGTYDLVNIALLRDWPWGIGLIDVAWGTFATTVAAGLGARAKRRR